MNSLNNFVTIVSVLLAVEAAHKDFSSKPDGCPVKFPSGFFCKLICKDWHILKGNTVTCFIANDGEYHRFIGRNPAHGIWRFYKVDENADVKSLCKVSANGDKFFLNKTDVKCSASDSPLTTLLPHEDMTTHTTKHPDIPDEDHDNSTSESTPNSKRSSLKDLIEKINEEVAKLFKGKTEMSDPDKETETETKRRAIRSALRHASPRSSSTKSPKGKHIPPMDDICQLVTTDVCRQHKLITCETTGDCCWAETDSEACNPDSLTKYDECYKGLGVIMATLLH